MGQNSKALNNSLALNKEVLMRESHDPLLKGSI